MVLIGIADCSPVTIATAKTKTTKRKIARMPNDAYFLRPPQAERLLTSAAVPMHVGLAGLQYLTSRLQAVEFKMKHR